MATPSEFESDPMRRSVRRQIAGAVRTDAESMLTAQDMHSVQELRLLFSGNCFVGMDLRAASMQLPSIVIPAIVMSDMVFAS